MTDLYLEFDGMVNEILNKQEEGIPVVKPLTREDVEFVLKTYYEICSRMNAGNAVMHFRTYCHTYRKNE